MFLRLLTTFAPEVASREIICEGYGQEVIISSNEWVVLFFQKQVEESMTLGSELGLLESKAFTMDHINRMRPSARAVEQVPAVQPV